MFTCLSRTLSFNRALKSRVFTLPVKELEAILSDNRGLLAQQYLLPANSTSYSNYNKCLVRVISKVKHKLYIN